MLVTITKSKANGTVCAPPSKSVAHRALICSYLAGGGKLTNLAMSSDIKATGDCIESLKNGTELFCGESGSTLRFFIPLCLLDGKEHTLSGSPRLFERDLSVYENICKAQGIMFEKTATSVTVKGRLKSGSFKVAGNISSQFITGLLFALPLLEGDSEIEITNGFESRPYIDLTEQMLARFGIQIRICDNIITVRGSQKYQKTDVEIEGDYSNAAFFDAFNCIGSVVKVSGLDKASKQGDKIYKEYFEALKTGAPTLDVSDCPDLAPVLMAVASLCGGCKLTGTHRLKIKESDRAQAMKQELAKLGCECEVFENEVTVGTCKYAPRQNLCSHNDHRIAMALSLVLSRFGGSLDGAQAVSKSLPEFFEMIKSLGIEVIKNEA